MEKKSSIFIFVLFISIFASLSAYIFFTNSSNLELKLQSHHENIRKHSMNASSFSQSLKLKDDSIAILKKNIKSLNTIHKKDSVTISRKNAEIKKLLHLNDSLAKVNHQ